MVDGFDNTTVRLSGIVSESVVDGVGFRMTVFTQGCTHNCKGCHNPQTHDPLGGEIVDLQFIADEIDKDPLLDGITLSGGEPFMQPKPLAMLCKYVHERGMNVWCYSGYTYEQLRDKAETDADVSALLAETDVLVDGPFIEEKKDLRLKVRGSSTQRVIDMKKTEKQGSVVWLDGMQ